MGLTICVGLPPSVREGDPEYVEYFDGQVEAVNGLLDAYGLPEYQEPSEIEEERAFEFELPEHAFLHCLRRLAAHLALKGELPPPGDERAASDPVLADYQKIFDVSLAQGKAAEMPFQHLIVHSDAEGFYVPVEFEEVIVTDPSLEIAGGIIGSSHALLGECRELALALELPEGLPLDEEAADAAIDAQGEGDAKWERYRVEAYACLALLRACEVSAETGAAVVFA